MPVPFDLPDLCNLYHAGEAEPYAEDVPCRQVPNMVRGRATNDSFNQLTWTHWVDFAPDAVVIDNAFSPPGGVLIQAAAGGDIIEILTDDLWLQLHVIWVEDRYTNTPSAYTRAYCIRTFREV